METVVKNWRVTERSGLGKNVLKNKNVRVKYLICCIWQGKLLPSGSILNKIEACEW